jgi:peptidoglycan-N-acetylglucosamine deacetylase
MRLFRPARLARCLYPEAVFRIKTTEKILFLTFDDGPDPESTPLLIRILGKHNVKAMFFCNGLKAEREPVLMDLIRQNGHITGNHTYNHADGWLTSYGDYINEAEKAAASTSHQYFRPPYGRLRFKQYKELKKKYRIFFWDLMAYDFDRKLKPPSALRILCRKMRPGSVIVLHDKQYSTSVGILDEFLTVAKASGYRFDLPV